MTPPRIRRLALSLAVAFLVAAPLDHALAKKPKSRLTAFVNGRKLKASKRGLSGVNASTGFSIAGATKPKKGVVRTVTATCLGNVRTAVLPATFTDCFGSYTEAGGKSSSFREWTGGGVTVVVEVLDGNRIIGTFAGPLENPSQANPTTDPGSIEDGSFSIVLVDIGV